MSHTREIKVIIDQMRNEGYVEGTPQYEWVFLKRKTERCQELHQVPSCHPCINFDYCEQAKTYLRGLLAIQQHAAAEAAKRKAEAIQRLQVTMGPIMAVAEKKSD